MVFNMLTFRVDDDEDEVFNFRPGSPPYMGSWSSSSSSSVSSPTRARCSCIGGFITQRSSSPAFPSLQLLQLQDYASRGGEVEIRRIIRFSLSSMTTLIIQKGDITKWSIDGHSDAIVNPVNEELRGDGGGADGAIHRAAGPELLKACYKFPQVYPGVRCPTGEARITPGFRLPVSHVIHTVGPMYYINSNPQASLANAYRNSMSLAKQNGIQHIAFTSISCGLYSYPPNEAALVAISTIKEFSKGLKEVHIILFGDEGYDIWSSKAKALL